MPICPGCGKEIENNLKKCSFCGSYITKGRRFFECLRFYVEPLTFIAAIGVLIVMIWSNFIMKSSIEFMRKTIEVEKSKEEVLRKESMEKNRPRIEISSTKVESSDSGLIVYIDVENKGFSDAEDVLVLIICKYPIDPKDSLSQSWIHQKVTKNRGKNLPFLIPTSYRGNFYALVDVRYSWPLYNIEYKDHKYFHYIFDEDNKKFSIKVMDEISAKKVWK